MCEVGRGKEVVSLIALPDNSLLVPFLGSLAFVCWPWSLTFDLGKTLARSVASPYLTLEPCCSGMRWQGELLTFYLGGYGGLQLPSLPPPIPPPSLLSSPLPHLVLQSSGGHHSTLTGSTIPGPTSQVDFSVIIKKEKLQQPTLALWVSFSSSPFFVIWGGFSISSR